MNQKKFKYGIMISMVLMLMLAFAGAASAEGTIITINPGDDLQAVLDSAVSGDTIYFNAGYYDYSAVGSVSAYDKSLTLTGAGVDVVTVDIGDDGSWNVGKSDVSEMYNITIENINFTSSSSGDGYQSQLYIYLPTGGNFVLRNCVLMNTAFYTYGANNVDISDNVISSSFNYASDRLSEIRNTKAGGSVLVSGNALDGAYLEVDTAPAVQIYGNTFTNAPDLGDFNAGLWLNGVTGATVTENTFAGNDAAIEITGITSSDNTICLNNFVDNRVNYEDGGSNTGAISYVSDAMAYTYMGNALGPSALGNYYSDYTGTDAGIDGIGDSAYTAVAGDDAAPLMGAWDAATDTIIRNPATITVNPGDDIQAAFDSAVSGDTLYFTPGYYDYSAVGSVSAYDKSLTLTGAGVDVVTVDIGDGGSWNVGKSDVSEMYNITIENINFTSSSSGDGYQSQLYIYLPTGGNFVLRNCVLMNTAFYTYGANNVDISDNVISSSFNYASDRLSEIRNTKAGGSVLVSGNALDGAYLEVDTAPAVQIYGNTFTNAPDLGDFNAGLWLNGVSGATVSDNTFDGNDAAIEITGITGSDNKICLNNFVNNRVNYEDGGSNTGTINYGSDAMAYTYMGNALGPSALGNYYSDYTGTDAGIDGIGDTAYTAVAGNDAAPLMGAWDAATDTIEVTPYVLCFVSGDASVIEDQTTQIQIMASALPEGLSGYNLTVVIDDPTVAEIVDVEYPVWASMVENSSMPGTSIYLKALDGSSQVEAGAEGVVLATLTVSGKEFGSTGLTLSVDGLDDDSGTAIDATLSTGALEVTMTPLPGQTVSAQDIGGNGLYEDLNGDGQLGFVDVEVFFNNKEWIDANMPVECSDFNGNGRIDFDDIVDLFELVV